MGHLRHKTMELNYLKFSEQYYLLEWIRSDMFSKLSEYKTKTGFKLDYSELDKKISCISYSQAYITELYESHRIESKRNFDLEHLLLMKQTEIQKLKEDIKQLNQEKEF